MISGGFELRTSILIWWSFTPGNLRCRVVDFTSSPRYLISWVGRLIDLRLLMINPRFVSRNIRVSKWPFT